MELHFPGDDLFAPLERRRGLPIGNLTSQFFANVYLNGFDHFCKEVLRARGYLRYVDDFALFHDDPAQLEEWRRRVAVYLEGRRLILHPRKTTIQPTSVPASFLGFVLLPDGRRRLPEDNVRRFRNRLRGLRDRWRQGTVAMEEVATRIRSWIAHAEHANTWRLRQSVFRASPFRRAREPGPPASAFSAAAPGTKSRSLQPGSARGTPRKKGTSAPRIATGTPPATATTTGVSVWPARSTAGVGGAKASRRASREGHDESRTPAPLAPLGRGRGGVHLFEGALNCCRNVSFELGHTRSFELATGCLKEPLGDRLVAAHADAEPSDSAKRLEFGQRSGQGVCSDGWQNP